MSKRSTTSWATCSAVWNSRGHQGGVVLGGWAVKGVVHGRRLPTACLRVDVDCGAAGLDGTRDEWGWPGARQWWSSWSGNDAASLLGVDTNRRIDRGLIRQGYPQDLWTGCESRCRRLDSISESSGLVRI